MKSLTLPIVLSLVVLFVTGCRDLYDEPPISNINTDQQQSSDEPVVSTVADHVASSLSELNTLIEQAKDGDVIGLNYNEFQLDSPLNGAVVISKSVVLTSSNKEGTVSSYGENQAVLSGSVCIDIPDSVDGTANIRITNLRFEQVEIDTCGSTSNSRSIINIGKVGDGDTPVYLDNLVFDGVNFNEPTSLPTAWVYSRGLVHISDSRFFNKQVTNAANSIVYLNCGSNRINGGSNRESKPTIDGNVFSLISPSDSVNGVVAGQFDGKQCNVLVSNNTFENFAKDLTTEGQDAITFESAAIVDGASDDISLNGNTFAFNDSLVSPPNDQLIPTFPTPNKYATSVTLQSVVDTAISGDVIGLDGHFSGDDFGSLVLTESVKFVGATEADGLFTQAIVEGGQSCILIATNNIEIQNIAFNNVQGTCLDSGDPTKDTSLINIGSGTSTQDGSGNSPGDIKPTGIVLNKVVIDDSSRSAIVAPYHHIIVRGSADIIASEFLNKPAQELGTFVNIRNDSSSHTDTRIMYNLFYNLNDGVNYIASLSDSTIQPSSETGAFDIFAIQVGTSSTKQEYATKTQIENNLFESNYAPRRLIRVRSSENIIHSNTIKNSYGWISFGGGENNQFTNNLVVANGATSTHNGKYESQLRFIGKGDVIENNYFEKVTFSATGNEAGAIAIWEAGLESTDDFTERSAALVRNNTIVDSKQSFLIAKTGECIAGSEESIVHFENNLIANVQLSGQNAYRDDCGLNSASTWTGESYGVSTLSSNGTLDALVGTGATLLGDNGAEVEPNSDGLYMPTVGGNVEGKGASGLILLTVSDVGLNATNQ
ncbi:chondroitinase-B domain-containing protein [Vibrio sonorensis]|uniref:chondroitinase-B domain-containing protein n=1 Tax=Vibrio sonorensis TaxID=1004316 RepID=UPI0008D99DE1|nr:chondroitinase-B domain-containing protein [Vibrio sonorensis]